jgi:hypothetical protein
MNRALLDLGMEPLGAEDIGDSEKRALFIALVEQIQAGGTVQVETLRRELVPSLLRTLEEAQASLEKVASLSDEWVEIDAVHRALMLREQKLRRRMEELRFLQEDARSQQDGEAAKQWGHMVDDLADQLGRLQRDKAARTSLKGPRAGHTLE